MKQADYKNQGSDDPDRVNSGKGHDSKIVMVHRIKWNKIMTKKSYLPKISTAMSSDT